MFLLSILNILYLPACVIDKLGGAFSQNPHQRFKSLSPGAKTLVDEALKDVPDFALRDYHVHIVGIGSGGTENFVNPNMTSWMHPFQYLQFKIYQSASGIKDLAIADQQYVERLQILGSGFNNKSRFQILAFDKHYNADGLAILPKTNFYIPNSWVYKISQQYPQFFIPVISIHPYRKDALERLEYWAAKGIKYLKWLPNAMGIDPANPQLKSFYLSMKKHGIILLTHAGDEKAVHSEEDQKYGNPLRLRYPLDLGVKMIVAHLASLGEGKDIENPQKPWVANFDLLMRLMENPKYEKILYADISALAQFNRIEYLSEMIARKDLYHRFVNGSDYPLPGINFLIRTKLLVEKGLLAKEIRPYLNEIYEYNPLLFDYVLKRNLRLPGQEKPALPASIFTRHLEELAPE